MLSRRDIEKELGKGINIFPVIRENFKENSINLSASRDAWTMGNGTVYWHGGDNFNCDNSKGSKRSITLSKGSSCIFTAYRTVQYIILLPHTTTLVETKEVLGVENNIGGALYSKVGIVSTGIGHIGTMLGPGYCGHLLIPLHNITDDVIALKVGATFVSVSFDYLSTPVIRTSSTVSGHLDKFSEFGINIDKNTRTYLTADWKSNLDGIRERMCAEDSYKDYKRHIRRSTWKELQKYINKRNIIAILSVIILVGCLYLGAIKLDQGRPQPVWVDRFWNVGCSGIVGTLVIGLFNFIKDKK